LLLYFNVCCFLFVTHEKEAVIRPLYYVSFILQEILDFSSVDWKKYYRIIKNFRITSPVFFSPFAIKRHGKTSLSPVFPCCSSVFLITGAVL